MQSEQLTQMARDRGIRRELNLPDGKVVYFEYPSAAIDPKTVVMVHGYRGNHRGLEAIAAGLDNFHVIIPDLPGFGESDPLKREHSVANYANWLMEFIHAVGVSESANLIGHSFGTLVVGTYAAEHSTKSVSLINPVSRPALDGPRAMLTTLARLYYLIAGFAPKIAGEWLLRNKIAVMVMSVAMAKTKDKALRRWIHQQHISNFSDFSSVVVAQQGYEASISIDLSRIAESISAPVLVIAAELDDITDIKAQREVAKLYSNVTYKEIPKVGHLVHYESPEIAASYIREFLDKL